MEDLSTAGVTMVYILTVLSVIVLLICIGKFFYITPFRQIYDFINHDEDGDSVLLTAFFLIPTTTFSMWFGICIGSFGIMMVGLVLGTFLGVLGVAIFFIGGLIGGFFTVLIPKLKKVHEDIVRKHKGE